MTTSHELEAAYRRRLRAYPRRWRAERGEELLAVLLAAAQDAGRRRPTAGETLDLMRNGLATRARQAMQPFSPALRARVATLSLAGGASMALVCLLCGELPLLPTPDRAVSYRSMTTFAPLLTVGAVLYLGWLIAFALTVAGRLRPTGTTGALLLALSGGVAVTSVAARSHPIAAPPLHLAVFFAAMSLLTCLGRVELSRRGRRLLVLGTTGLAAVLLSVLTLVLTLATRHGVFDVEDPRWVFYRGSRSGIQLIAQGAWVLVVVALAVAALVSRRRPGWFTASVVAGLPWLYFTLLFVAGSNVPRVRLPALVFVALAVMAGPARLGYRIGRRPRPDAT